MTLCLRSIDKMRNQPKAEWSVLKAAFPVYYLFLDTLLAISEQGPVLVRVYPNGPNPSNSFSQDFGMLASFIPRAVVENERLSSGLLEQNGVGAVRAAGFAVLIVHHSSPADRRYLSLLKRMSGSPNTSLRMLATKHLIIVADKMFELSPTGRIGTILSQ